MIIKKIELQGFKSFPERTKILFHPGITCIVGPNGTGKSNIVDALLWALGGQRMRSQRAERSGDVIFNGNQKKAPLGMADVNLYLQDDEEELIINHRLFRSGESEYRLGGKMVRLKDIQESLWKRAVAEKEYFVIEQGQIGLFLNSKPTEKRLLLEEAAGTAYYKDKKKQAQNKLETSEQNLIRLEDIIAEVSKAKNSLKRQAAAAIRYKKLREKIRQLTSLHYRRKISILETNLQEIIKHYENCLNQEASAISRLKSEEKSLANKRTEVWNLEKSIKDDQKGLFTQKSELARMETDREKEERRVEFFREKKKEAAEDIDDIKLELQQLEKENEDARKSLELLGQSLREKQKALEEAEKASQESQEELSSSGEKMKTLRSEHFQKLSDQTEALNERVKLEKEKELLLRQEEKLRAQLLEERMLFEDKEKKLEEETQELSLSQKQEEEKKRTIEALQKELNGILASIEDVQTKISELEGKKEDEAHHLQALERLEKKERGTDVSEDIPKALGYLADLIETDAEYAPLIDIFWKEEAKAMLIRAQDLLAILENKDIKGRFLLLSSLKKEEPASKILQEPQVLGLFKSYLRPSPKIKDHLSHLQEAAIVKDMKSAIQLWLRFPSLNYLTLQGDLMLASGLLELGQKKEGIFALAKEIKKIKETIAAIEKQIEPLSLEHQEKSSAKQGLQQEMETETALLGQIQEKIEDIEKEVRVDQIEKDKIKTRLDLLQDELGTLAKDRDALTKTIEDVSIRAKTLEAEENSLKKNLEEIEKEGASLREKNEERKKNFFESKASISLIQEKTSNLNSHLQEQKRRQESLERKIASLQNEIQKCEEEEIQCQKNIEVLSKRTQSLEEEGKTQEEELAARESHLQQMKKEQEDMEKSVEQLREDVEAKKEERVKREISKAEAERDLVNLEESCWQELKKTLQEVKDEIPEEHIQETKTEEKLAEAEEELQKYKSVNLMAEEEYLIQKKRYDFLMQQKKDLRESIDATREAIQKIDEESKNQFVTALAEVNRSLQEVFSILFNGGSAELKLVDPNDPLESGAEISAQPPGKKVQSLSLLSGGEKSLTSLAFFFALFRYKPTPFCVLDEVDAALDDVNLARFLELMKKVKSQTQFIIITHNIKTMEVADYIYGTTMAEPNITSLYSVKLEKKEGSSKNI